MANQSHTHLFGQPLNIVKFGEGNKLIIDDAGLQGMFLHPEVKNRKVVAFSIIGAFRRGKSFFLDYCLRYLYAHYPSVKNPKNAMADKKNWMGSAEEGLSGFSWRSGTRRDTTGIIMWSDVFLHTISTTGEKIAIVVIDTQGLFDNETSPADNSRVFALGTLISSIQILNLFGNIQEDQLQYLQFATEFARFVSQDSHALAGGKPFQSLLFLLRDWVNPDVHKFGFEGGKEYLNEVLKVQVVQKEELRTVRHFINSSFERLECCLLPHPGKHVAGSKSKGYNGNWKLMDDEFKDELFALIENLLKEENLILKQINGKDLKAFEYKEYLDGYFKLFQSDELPEAKSIYESTVDKQMSILIEKCLDFYKKSAYNNKDLLIPETIPIIHGMCKSDTLLMFNGEKKMGNKEHEKKYRDRLEMTIEKSYAEWKKQAETSIEKLKIEAKKTEDAIKENKKLQDDILKAEEETKKKHEELERQKEMQLIETSKYEAEKKVIESRLEAEKARSLQVEAEREAEKAQRQVLEEKLKNEQLLAKAQKENGGCCNVS